jgi:hypothetical protein
MTTKAMSLTEGKFSNRRSTAGKPPAEAPIPTTGKCREPETIPAWVGTASDAAAGLDIGWLMDEK